MIELVIVYCLAQDRLSCIEKRPVSEYPLTPISCMMSGQTAAAEFLHDHPAYALRSWRCEIGHPPERSA